MGEMGEVGVDGTDRMEGEKSRRVERWRETMRQRAEAGRQPISGKPPLGYRIVTVDDVLDGRRPRSAIGQYEIVEEEATIVRRAFQSYVELKSLTRVAARAQEQGWQTRDGGRWHAVTLRSIYRNTAYVGEARFGKFQCKIKSEKCKVDGVDVVDGVDGVDGVGGVGRGDGVGAEGMTSPWILIPCPAIIDRELFETVEELLRMHNLHVRVTQNGRHFTLLGGRIWCGGCGNPMRDGIYKAGKGHGRGHYYGCPRCPPTPDPNSPRPRYFAVPARAVDKAVFEALRPYLSEDDFSICTEMLVERKWPILVRDLRRVVRIVGLETRVRPRPFVCTATFGGQSDEEALKRGAGLLASAVRELSDRSGEEWRRRQGWG